MKNWFWIILGIAVASLSATSIIVAFSPKEPANELEILSVKVAKNSKPEKVRITARSGGKPLRLVVDNKEEKEREKPTFNLDDDEEAHLTDAQRELIEAIRKALDAENEHELLRLIQKLQASKEWPDGIPKSIKLAAVEALGWFGPTSLPELVGFLADRDEEVVSYTIDQFEEKMSDFDLSDREKSDLLLMASKFITDPDAMDSMLFELNNMRHSVAVETMKGLLASDNPAVQENLQENIEFYTGEENLDTAEKLDSWLAENPDDEDDEEFYGGASATSSSNDAEGSADAAQTEE